MRNPCAHSLSECAAGDQIINLRVALYCVDGHAVKFYIGAAGPDNDRHLDAIYEKPPERRVAADVKTGGLQFGPRHAIKPLFSDGDLGPGLGGDKPLVDR